MRVLVTGFGPFLDNPVNPSDRLARALDGRCRAGVTFTARTPLPVEHRRAAEIALDAARAARADAIVAFGLAAGTARIRLESLGRNRLSSPHPDGAGDVRAGRAVVPGGPGRLAATLPARPIAAALRAAGIRVEHSSDAGGYVCNDLF